jgi:hypothetical protein
LNLANVLERAMSDKLALDSWCFHLLPLSSWSKALL